ncbi:MAG: hypothetical protein AABZ57_04865, partial [Candidatus Margulisiibacteriota bacterium]
MAKYRIKGIKLMAAAALIVFAACQASYCETLNTVPTAEAQTRISLNLKDAPISSALSALGQEARLNIVTGRNVNGKITISLKDVTASEALFSIIKASGLSAKREAGIIRITSPSETAGDEISREKGVITKTFISNYLSADDVRETLSKLGYEDTKIISTKGSNIIVVEGSANTMSKVSRIIKKLTATPNQVLVESRIMEITAGNAATPSTLGIKAKYTGTTFTTQTEGFANPAAVGVPGFYAHVLKGNAEAYLQALEHKEGFNMLANPKVIAVNEKPASIISGSKLGYKTSITTTTGTIQTVDYLEVGTKLEFTPYISSDGSIKMEIHPEVSEGSVNSDGLPQKNTTEAKTTVIVRDGETIVIGGLIKSKSTETLNGIPIVMDLPFIGNFFKKKELLWEKKEIIAMLTPHLITPKILKEMGS